MSISNNMLKNFRADLELATQDLAKKHGIVLEFGAMTYNETQFTFSTTATIGESKEDVQRTNFERDAWKFGLNSDDYGKIVTIQGKKHKIIGVNTRASKMPIIVQGIDNGQRYKVSEGTIKNKLS